MNFHRRRLTAVVLTIALVIGFQGLGTVLAQDEDTPVNINTADETTLMMLKGIGEVKARAIIEYRQQQPFETIEDIMNVSGIGEKTFEDNKHRIVVEDAAEE